MRLSSRDKYVYFVMMIFLILSSFLGVVFLLIMIFKNYFMEVNIDIENKKIITNNVRKKQIKFEQIKDVSIFENRINIYDENKNVILFFPKSILESNGIKYENFYAFLMEDKYNVDLLKIYDYRILEQKNDNSNIFLLIVIGIYILINILGVLFSIHRIPIFPIVNSVLYIIVLFLITPLLICLYLLFKKLIKPEKYFIKNVLSSIMVFLIVPYMLISFFGMPKQFYISKTTDISNYSIVLEKNRHIDYFPKTINDDMKVIDFIYYADRSWDLIEEIYLEIEFNEKSFNEEYVLYEETSPCVFNSKLDEKVFYEVVRFDDKDGYVSFASIEKIIYDRERMIISYYYLYVTDSFYLDEWYYINKYNIDVKEYYLK